MAQYSTKANFFIYTRLALICLFAFSLGSVKAQSSDGLPRYQMQVTKGNLSSFTHSEKKPEAYAKVNKGEKSSHPEFGQIPFNADYPGFVEILNKRTVDERYFVNAEKPSEFRIQKGLTPLHYKKNGEWVTIDHRLSEKGNGIFEASNQYDPVGFNVVQAKSYIQTPQGKIDFNNWKLFGETQNGQEEFIATANWSNYTAGDDGVYVNDIFPGIDAQMIVNRGSVKTSFIVKQLNHTGYKNLIFRDGFVAPISSYFNYTDGTASTERSKSEVKLMFSGSSVLEIGQATAYPENPSKEETVIAEYEIRSTNLGIVIPVEWIRKYIGSRKVIIDPLVTSSNSLAQASITGSMYNGTCNFTNFCSYNLSVNTPANATLTDVKWSFAYLAQGLCYLQDGAVRFTTGGCTSPSAAGFYWYCNAIGGGTCTGNNVSIWSDVSSCMPAPSCAPVSVPFTMQFFRSCFGAAGCSGTCIGANSPWTMTLEGHTVEWTNAATPFTLSSNTVCAGGNLTATSNGVTYGVPTRNITWSFNSSGIPTVAAGTPASINFPAAGNYTVYGVVTDGCGVQQIVSQTATAIAIPTANAGSTKSLTCIQTTTVLNGSGGGAYSWTGPGTITSPTSQNPTVNTAGTFSLTVNVAGCISPAATVAVVLNNTPPSVSAGTSGSVTCTNSVVNLTSNPAGMTYTWTAPAGSSITGGVNNQNTTGSGPGTYTVKATDAVNGCTNIATIAANINTSAPTGVTAGTSGSVTCTNSGISLSSTPGSGVTYTWTAPAGSSITGGANNQNTTGSGAGTYTVKVADAVNGCTAVATVAANVNTTPPTGVTASTTGSITCTNTNISLNGAPGSGGTYTWTAPAGGSITGGANSQNTTGSGSGTYTLVFQSSVNGCTASATAAPPINTTPPTGVTASTTGSITCTNSVVSLNGAPSTGGTYTWTAPAGGSITGGTNVQNTTGSGSGTYTLVFQSSVNGCTASATAAPPINTTPPTGVTASTTSSITCTNSVVSLNGTPGSGGTYTWTAPAGGSITGGANSQNTTGQGSGTYTLVFQSSVNGCTTSATAVPPINTTPPTGVTASTTGSITCSSSTISLSGTPGTGGTYTWTAPAGGSITGGVNSQNTTGSGSGTYTLAFQSSVNGCTAQATAATPFNTVAPTPSVSPTPTLTCLNTTVTLSGNPASGVTYTWSGPGIVGSANNQTVNVNQVGTYSLFVTSAVNGCTNVANAAVSNNTIQPTITPVATQTITCSTPSVQLVGSANPSSCTVVWTGGVCGGATSYTATACSPGTYTYVATDPSNGCQSAAQVATVVPNSGIPSATLANTGTITCATTSVQVVSTTTTTPVLYNWSGPGIIGATNTGTIDVNQSGVYTLTLTNMLNGCSSVITNSVTADNAPFTPTTASSTTITCTNTTSTLSATVGAGTYTYSWSGSGIVGSNTLAAITASASGLYTVVATNTDNGCSGTQTVSVISDISAPTSVAASPTQFTLSCLTPSTQITASSTGGATYSWTAPGTGAILSGGSTATVTISGPGVYSVVATGTNGCSAAAATATMIADANAPSVSLSANTVSITCSSTAPDVTVTPTGTVTILSYSWSPSSGISSGSNTTTPTFTASGTYSCLVTANNGCTTTTFVTVADNTVQPVATATAANISCVTTSVDINPNYTPSSGLTYTWTGAGIVGATTNSSITVNQSGTYTVSFMDPANGCTNTAQFTVNGNTIAPTVTVASSSTVGLGCSGSTSTITLDASCTPSTGINYNWSTSASTQTISVTAAGIYSVIVTDATNGCSVTAQYTVVNNTTVPTGTAGASAFIPCGGATSTVTLNGSSSDPGVTFTWDGPGIVSGSNTANPVVNAAGVYTLTVTNPTTGCIMTSTVDVINSVPTASMVADVTSGFSPLAVTFTNTSVSPVGTTFSWSFGDGSTSTSSTTASANYTSAGSYSVILIATAGPCSDTATVVIEVTDGFKIDIPNVFTPNGDNVNDVFSISSTGVKEITLQIFNRWGQLMYEFNGAKAAWDGMTSTGHEASVGTYFYFVKATGFDGKEFEKKGTLNLFR